MSRATETNRGLEQQRLADEALTGAPICGTVRRERGSAWVCVRPPHDAGHRDVDEWRRRTRGAVQADRHAYASAPDLALLEPEAGSQVP